MRTIFLVIYSISNYKNNFTRHRACTRQSAEIDGSGSACDVVQTLLSRKNSELCFQNDEIFVVFDARALGYV